MSRLGRGWAILRVVWRYGLDVLLLQSLPSPAWQRWGRVLSLGRRLDAPRGERLRQALEDLGPIFVKLGQVLSTRRDLLAPDIALELAKLQDRVPPFPSEIAVAAIEQALGKPLSEIFVSFEHTPVASASIAQVHFAVLRDRQGREREVAVKVLRPGMLVAINNDLGLMHLMADVVGSLSADGRRLKPREVVAEFDKYLHDELDLIREASSAAQLRRNMAGLDLVLIPEMLWDHCTTNVLVMERMHGVPISQVQRLRDAGVDIQKLARDGVMLFFTQVFRDGFFHADMHPAISRSAWIHRPLGATSRWTSALWVRSPKWTKSTWRKILSLSSAATTNAWPSCMWSRVGCPLTRGWTNWSPPSVRCASRTLTAR